MKAKAIETWVWVLIYGGLLSLCLGFFVQLRGGLLGWPLLLVGALAVVLGGVLIAVRARMPADE